MVQDSGQMVRDSEIAGAGYASLYLPLRASMRVRGVLAIALAPDSPDLPPETVSLLEALASLVAIAIERLHYVDVAQASQLDMVSERLRSSILSALSHDLRTPLTALVGLADSLFLIQPPLPPTRAGNGAGHARAGGPSGRTGRQSARHGPPECRQCDTAQANGNRSRKSSVPASSCSATRLPTIRSAYAAGRLPLLEFDAVLIERVFCNLLENAAKYAPAGTADRNRAPAELADDVEITVCDHGPGFRRRP